MSRQRNAVVWRRRSPRQTASPIKSLPKPPHCLQDWSFAPEPATETALSHVEFVGLDDGRPLVVMVHEDGRVENRLMPRPDGILSASLERVGNFLSARLRGRQLSEARADILAKIEQGRAAIDVAAAMLIKHRVWPTGPTNLRKTVN